MRLPRPERNRESSQKKIGDDPVAHSWVPVFSILKLEPQPLQCIDAGQIPVVLTEGPAEFLVLRNVTQLAATRNRANCGLRIIS